MLSFMILFALLVWIIGMILRGKVKILTSDLFWLLVPWGVCIALYFSIQEVYVNKLSIDTFLYVIFVLFLYWIMRKFGEFAYKGTHRGVINNEDQKLPERRVNVKLYAWISIFATIVYSVDRFVSSGFVMFDRVSMSISIVGTIASFFMGPAFIIPIYEVGYSIRNQVRLRGEAILCMICWSFSSIMTSGRQELIYLVIGVLTSACWAITKQRRRNIFGIFNENKILRKLKLPIVCVFILVFIYLIGLSVNRYDDFYSGNSLMYLLGGDFPADVNKMAQKLGPFGKLAKNIFAYFSHQISVFEIIFKKYQGPYMYGMYQMNFVARRIGIDYTLVESSYYTIVKAAGNPGFTSAWPTAFGTMIFDFGRIGMLLEVALLGFCIGYVYKKRKIESSSSSNVFPCIACVYAFSTVMVGLTYYSLYWFAFVWCFIMFRKRRKKWVINKSN